MIPETLHPLFSKLGRVHACMRGPQREALLDELFRRKSGEIITILSTPDGPYRHLQEAWIGVRLPYIGTHGGGVVGTLPGTHKGQTEVEPVYIDGGCPLAISSIAITSLALATLHKIKSNLPDALQKYSLYERWIETEYPNIDYPWVFIPRDPSTILYNLEKYRGGDPYESELQFS